MDDWVRPEDVTSPRNKWRLIEALLDQGPIREGAGIALALGVWDGQPVLAMRWNGNPDWPKGHPVSSGHPTWFVVPGVFVNSILDGGVIAEPKVKLARRYLPKPG